MKAGWEVKPLGEVCAVQNGGTPKSKVAEYWGDEVPWLTPKDMGQQEVPEISDTPRKITKLGLSKCSARLVPVGSVIMSTRAPIGHLSINTVPMAFNQGCRGLTPSELIDLKYLFYFLKRSVEDLQDLGTGTTFKELSAGALKGFEIPIPPLEEQKQIVAVLDAAFEGLTRAKENAEANLQNAQELFERGLSSLFLGLVGAKRVELGSVASFHNGDRGKNYPNKVDYVSEGVPWLNTGHIMPDGSLSATKMNFITQQKFESLRGGRIQVDDLVFCLRGATIGKTAFVYPYEVGAIASSLMIIRPSDELHSRFAYYFLTSELGKSEINRFIAGAAQPNLAGKSVGKFVLPLPSMDIQRSICDQLDTLRGEVGSLRSQYQAKLTDIADLRQSLLQKAFTGELT